MTSYQPTARDYEDARLDHALVEAARALQDMDRATRYQFLAEQVALALGEPIAGTLELPIKPDLPF